MYLEGTGCDGLSADFVLYEYDGSDLDGTSFDPSMFTGTFPSYPWRAVWMEDSDGHSSEGNDNNPEYRFTATIGIESERSPELKVTRVENVCDSAEICSDGSDNDCDGSAGCFDSPECDFDPACCDDPRTDAQVCSDAGNRDCGYVLDSCRKSINCGTCSGTAPYCDSSVGQCTTPPAQCVDDGGCNDDGKFCNGEEICVGGTCGHSGNPCSVGRCDESSDSCVLTTCADYGTDQVACERDSLKLGKVCPSPQDSCTIDCSCIFSEGSCDFQVIEDCPNLSPDPFSCIYGEDPNNPPQTNCGIDGTITINYVLKKGDTNQCEATKTTVTDCAQIASLPFFTWINILVSVMTLIILYGLFRIDKRIG
jgi:hypothetical protein